MQKLFRDNGTDLLSADQLMDLLKTCPADVVRLPGQQNDLGQWRFPLQAVMIVKGIFVPDGAQELKLIFLCPDAGLLKKLSGDGLTAGLPCLGCAAGIFPGTGKALALGSSGQQDLTLSVIDPNADHKAVLPRLPCAATAMHTARRVAFRIIYIIVFHGFAFFLRAL